MGENNTLTALKGCGVKSTAFFPIINNANALTQLHTGLSKPLDSSNLNYATQEIWIIESTLYLRYLEALTAIHVKVFIYLQLLTWYIKKRAEVSGMA